MASSHAADMAHLEYARSHDKLLIEIRDLLKVMVEGREDRILAEADAIRARRKAQLRANQNDSR